MQITAKDWSVCSVPHCPPHMRRVQCVRVDVRIPIRRDCRAEIGNRAISLAQAATQCQGKPAKTGIRDISFPLPFPLSCANYSSSSGLLHTTPARLCAPLRYRACRFIFVPGWGTAAVQLRNAAREARWQPCPGRLQLRVCLRCRPRPRRRTPTCCLLSN